MGWEQAGQGIFPIKGSKGPIIQATHQDGKTLFVIEMPEKLTSKELDKLIQEFFEQGKKFLTPPILDVRESTASMNMNNLMRANEEMKEIFLDSFSGIKVRKDFRLKANDWYCAVSPEIFEKLRER